MKKIFFIIVLCVNSITLFGQEPLGITEVVQVDGVSKDELFDRAKNWFAENFRDANSVLQVDDKANGQLVGKAIMKYTPTPLMSSDMFKGNIWYLVKITTREGRYKYEITSFTHEASGGKFKTIHLGLLTTEDACPENKKGQPKGIMNKFWKDTKDQSLALARPIAASIKSYMAQPTSAQNDDW